LLCLLQLLGLDLAQLRRPATSAIAPLLGAQRTRSISTPTPCASVPSSKRRIAFNCRRAITAATSAAPSAYAIIADVTQSLAPSSHWGLRRWSGAAPIDALAGDVAVVFSEPIAWVSSRGCVYTSQPIKAQSNVNVGDELLPTPLEKALGC